MKLSRQIVAWLKKQGICKRAHAEKRGDRLVFFHPCGHTSWELWNPEKLRFAGRIKGQELTYWGWTNGGVGCTCPKCYREELKALRERKMPRRRPPVKNLTRIGPDWTEGTMTLTFGKHNGKTVQELPLTYLAWAISFIKDRPELIKECKQEFKDRGYKLADLEYEVARFKMLEVFDDNGKVNRERVAELRQHDRDMAAAHMRVQMENLGRHLDSTIGESNGFSLIESDPFLFGSSSFMDDDDEGYMG